MTTATLTPARAFKLAMKGQTNPITPFILLQARQGAFFYQLSTGQGLLTGRRCWGVTVMDAETLKYRSDKSTLFYDKDNALDYITSGFDVTLQEQH